MAIHNKETNDTLNNSPNIRDAVKRRQLKTFLGSIISPNPRHWAPFGCPAYLLDRRLQEGKKINKWAYRNQVGIYLGRSPSYSRNVALTLNRDTGHVSPQFHLKLDTTFESIDSDWKHPWMVKAGFVAKGDDNYKITTSMPPKRASSNLSREGVVRKRMRLNAPQPPDKIAICGFGLGWR